MTPSRYQLVEETFHRAANLDGGDRRAFLLSACADDASLLREVESLLGDAAKARTKLGWRPRITFEQLVTEMIRHDLDTAKRDALVHSQGYKIPNPRE